MNARRPFSTAADQPPPPKPNARTTRGRTPPEALLRRVDWEIVRKLHGHLQGDYRSGALGEGLDVADLREYEVDDDVRRIDWNVTARMAEPYVRQYDEDREVTVWFVVDRSASMQFGHGGTTKEDVAATLTTAMSRVFMFSGNRVGALLWNNGATTVIEPRTGSTHLLRLISQLHEPTASPTANGPDAELANLLEAAAVAARRPSMVVVVSDFLTAPGWETAMRRLSVRHDVLAIRVLDPQESQLPDAGLVVVHDAETGEQLTVDTSDRKFRDRFAEAARDREASLQVAAARAGVDLVSVPTDADLTSVLLQMVARRKKRART